MALKGTLSNSDKVYLSNVKKLSYIFKVLLHLKASYMVS